MKTKTFYTTVFIALSLTTAAQQWTGATGNTGFVTRNGDIRLHDNQPWRVSLGPAWGEVNIGYGTGYLGFNLSRNNHSDGNWTFNHDGANNGGTVIYGDVFGNLMFSSRITNGASAGVLTDIDVVNNIKMKINANGKVVIGNPATLNQPGTYKLYVESGILTEKLKVAVKNSFDWADYVFAPNYKLMPLADVLRYTQKHRHLPGVPSAADVVNNGVDVGQMQSTLLGKIEELYLHTISLDQQLQKLKKANGQLAQAVAALKKRRG
jgi:hypothetical protein